MSFVNCEISFEDVTIISKFKSHLQELNFEKTGQKKSSNWEEYPQRFKNLMKAVSLSDIKNSLQNIDITDCGISQEEGQSILEDIGMRNLEIWT